MKFLRNAALALFSALLLCQYSFAATVDTVSIFSKAMGITKKCVVIQPDKKAKEVFPVVYLLHGYGGSYDNWIKRVPALKDYADQYRCIIVCPDGATNSWYVDSPVDRSMQYETYIGKEVPAFIDQHFPTIKDRKARAITGLSMGGHGALYIGWQHAGFFSAAGSMSGVVDLSSSTQKYELSKRIGEPGEEAENWKPYSMIYVVENQPEDSLGLIIDCGIKDVFYPYNQQLHQKLLQLNIAHDYTERPGGHDWNYWANAVQYHLLFFRNHFNRLLKQ